MLNTLTRGGPAALALGVLLAGSVAAPPGLGGVAPARAQPSDAQPADARFVRGLGARLTAVVNGPGSLAEKKAQVLPLLSQDVDVDGIGRFCLGRFWRSATPSQQARYLTLFHQVLVNSITGHLGEYKGVAIELGEATTQEGQTVVPTVITRPGQPAANVQWVISDAGGSPRVVDVVAEGVSLKLTQRNDYTSYLAHNGNNVDALLNALTRQVARAS